MREILFRAKRIDNGKWVEGTPYQEYVEFWKEWEWFIQTKHPLTNVPYMHLEIDRKTICEFTGLTDKNGKKIFENDIIVICYETDGEEFTETKRVHYNEKECCWYPMRWEECCEYCDHYTEVKSIEVIGNIHDNPELLENP